MNLLSSKGTLLMAKRSVKERDRESFSELRSATAKMTGKVGSQWIPCGWTTDTPYTAAVTIRAPHRWFDVLAAILYSNLPYPRQCFARLLRFILRQDTVTRRTPGRCIYNAGGVKPPRRTP